MVDSIKLRALNIIPQCEVYCGYYLLVGNKLHIVV